MKGAPDRSPLRDLICDSASKNPAEAALQQSLSENTRELLATLTVKEAEVLRLRYGLGGHKRLSLRELARVKNLSRERIRQIEKKALKKLRAPSRRVLLD